MARQQVCFISYLDQDNLGIGYVASYLLRQSSHFGVTLVDMRESRAAIVRGILNANPLIVGFSIISQLQFREFHQLMTDLRRSGIVSHFTAGGHYPSLRYEELMQLAPELDSVVLFEGEHTLVELAEALRSGGKWRGVAGLAYRENGKIISNALRPLEENLDRFPPPVRRPVRATILGRKVVNLLAGRGCYYHCSFCSIRSFYSKPPGKVKRVRDPERVVQEMRLHFKNEDCSIFLFQDDDFPVWGASGQDWIDEFCRQLHKQGLAGKVIWKISLRPNEVEEAMMSVMMAHGLAMVYLGIESGTLEGLNRMNKRLTPEKSLSAAQILKRLKLPFEFGFMMFDPYTTFDSVRENGDFLLRLCGDGSASIGLAKLIPLAGTDIENTLRSQGRLFGQAPYEDYAFLDPSLEDCFTALLKTFHTWMHSERGFMNYSRWARLQIEAFSRFCNLPHDAENARRTLHRIVSAANRHFLKTVNTVCDLAGSSSLNADNLNKLISDVAKKHEKFCARLNRLTARVDGLAGL